MRRKHGKTSPAQIKGRIAPITQCVKAFEDATSHLIKEIT